jgi:hypothetical protein
MNRCKRGRNRAVTAAILPTREDAKGRPALAGHGSIGPA